MTCSRNLSKHLNIVTKPKPIGKCCNMIFIFFKFNDFLYKKKWSNIFFSYFLFTFVQNFNLKQRKKYSSWHVFLNVFNHIVTFFKELHGFLYMIGAIFTFGENSFIFSFVGYGLVAKSLAAWCTFEKVEEKTKCQKMMNVNIFTIKLGWIIWPSFLGVKSLEATILYNDSPHNIPALQARTNKYQTWKDKKHHMNTPSTLRLSVFILHFTFIHQSEFHPWKIILHVIFIHQSEFHPWKII